MKPSKKLFEAAKAKARASFKPNANNTMQTIRLTSDETSYTLFFQMGIAYIGSYESESLPNFFKTRDVYDMTSDDEAATMQRLFNY